jgi:hypothetical protein
MTEAERNAQEKMRRTLLGEFVRMEDDFDTTRRYRNAIVDNLVQEASRIKLTDQNGQVQENTDTGVRVFTTILKALSDVEKANATAISLKLKQSEQEVAASTAAHDRILAIQAATVPGKIDGSFPSEDLESKLAELYDDQIAESELKISPKDLED